MLSKYWHWHRKMDCKSCHSFRLARVLPGATFRAATPSSWSWHPRWKLFHYLLNGLMHCWGDWAFVRVSIPLPWGMIWRVFFRYFFVRTLSTITLRVPGVSQTLLCIRITVCMSFQNADPGPRCQRWRKLFKSFCSLFNNRLYILDQF